MKTMSPKERVLRAVNHQETDQIPSDYWGTPEVDQMLMRYFSVSSLDEVLERLGVDIRYIYGSGIIYEEGNALYGPTARYIGPKPPIFEDGSFEDIWGVRRIFYKVRSGNIYREVVQNPLRNLNSVQEIENYDKWPKAEYFEFRGLREEAKKREMYGLIFGGVNGGSFTVFHQCGYLRGMEQVLVDLILSPALAHALIEKITEFQVAYHQKMLDEIGDLLDILMIADDYGTQSDLIMSRRHFQEFFKKPLGKLIELGKKHNLKMMMHCDGNIRKLIPDFIEMGIDILNPIQHTGPEMDPADLKREFGKHICFHGGIDTQQILPSASAEEVRKEVLIKINIFGKNGGYILAPGHLLQLDIPTENIIQFYQAPRIHTDRESDSSEA
jgi:uroporphyrinogen decarboxylase